MDETTGRQFDYVRLLRRILGRWKLILAVFIMVSIPITAWAMVFAPKTYEAVAKIFLEDPRRGGSGILRDWMPASDASFQLAILRSRSLAEAVVDNLTHDGLSELLERGMHRDYVLEARNAVRRLLGRDPIVYSPEQRAVMELQTTRVTFTALPAGEVEIRAIAYSPRVAMDLANTYVKVLQTRSRSNVRDDARASREFIENMLAQTKANLHDGEERLARAQRGRGSSLRLNDRSAVEAAQMAQLENALAEIQSSKEVARSRLSYLRGGKDAAGKPVPPAAQQQLMKRLAQLQEKLAALQERYTDSHPLVRATAAEIKDAQATLAAGPQAVQDRAASGALSTGASERPANAKQIAELELEIAALEAREQNVKQRIARVSQAMSSVGAEEMEVSKLRQSVESQRAFYSTLSEKLGTVRIQEQGDDRGLRLIDLASLPQRASAGPAQKLILLGMVLGLGLGVGLAAVVEYVKQPLESEEDLADTIGVPILGWLPTVEGKRADKGPGREPLSFVAAGAPDSLPVEACRSIRISLLSSTRGTDLRVIMLASAVPGEGKSTVALNLASIFSEAGCRLILADADLRRPSLHRPLRCLPEPGLADLLAGNLPVDAAIQTVKDGFDLIPAGALSGAKPGVLLSAERISRVLDLLRPRADLVLFDSAPVLAVADNLVLASMVDGVILVVRAGVTQRRDLIRAKNLLEKVGAPLVGVVLNRVSLRESRRYHRSYSGYYDIDERLAPPKRSRSRAWLNTLRNKSDAA
jgi:capsular exopolysaccharide synthesis family protein